MCVLRPKIVPSKSVSCTQIVSRLYPTPHQDNTPVTGHNAETRCSQWTHFMKSDRLSLGDGALVGATATHMFTPFPRSKLPQPTGHMIHMKADHRNKTYEKYNCNSNGQSKDDVWLQGHREFIKTLHHLPVDWGTWHWYPNAQCFAMNGAGLLV